LTGEQFSCGSLRRFREKKRILSRHIPLTEGDLGRQLDRRRYPALSGEEVYQ